MEGKHRFGGVAPLGIAITLLLGSGLFALATDTIASEGNDVISSTTGGGGGAAHDIQAARLPVGQGDCSAATYTDGPLTPLIASGGSANIDLAAQAAAFQQDDLCITNAGTAGGPVTVVFASVAETEVGGCEPGESSAGDTTCATGDQGELAAALIASFNSVEDPAAAAPCSGPGEGEIQLALSDFSSYSVGVPLNVTLAPGEVCRLYMGVQVTASATETDRALLQTDRVQWDVYFALTDP